MRFWLHGHGHVGLSPRFQIFFPELSCKAWKCRVLLNAEILMAGVFFKASVSRICYSLPPIQCVCVCPCLCVVCRCVCFSVCAVMFLYMSLAGDCACVCMCVCVHAAHESVCPCSCACTIRRSVNHQKQRSHKAQSC